MNAVKQILLDLFLASAENLKTTRYSTKRHVEVLITFGMSSHSDICLPLILDVLINTKHKDSRRLIYNALIDSVQQGFRSIPVEIETFAFMQDFQDKDGLLYCALLVYLMASFKLETRAEVLQSLGERRVHAQTVLAYFEDIEFGHRLTSLDYAYMDACHKCNQKFARK